MNDWLKIYNNYKGIYQSQSDEDAKNQAFILVIEFMLKEIGITKDHPNYPGERTKVEAELHRIVDNDYLKHKVG